MSQEKKSDTTRAKDHLGRPKGQEGSPCIARRIQGTARATVKTVFDLGNTVNIVIDGQYRRGVIAAFYVYPYEDNEGRDLTELDEVSINVKGSIMNVLFGDLLRANPNGPASKSSNLQCVMERSDESIKSDRLVDDLTHAGLFRMEDSYLAPIGEKTFLIGPILKNGSYLNVIVITADGQRRIPRLFYKSHSHGPWRASPYISRAVYDKGSDLFSHGEYSYTQSTHVHRELTRILDKLFEKQKGENGDGELEETDIVALAKFFNTSVLQSQPRYNPSVTVRNHKRQHDKGINTFSLETREFDFFKDAKGKAAVDAYKNLDLSQYGNSIGHFINRPDIRTGNLNKALETDRKLDLEKLFPGFVPEFKPENLAIVYERRHHLLGKYTVEVYKTDPSFTINGHSCCIEWEMAYDESGRVWIESIDLVKPNWVNSYGAYCYFINSGLLTQKPFEYKHTAKFLKSGTHYKDCEQIHYFDVTPLLDHLQPIRKYRAQREIKRKDKPNPLVSRLRSAYNYIFQS